MPAPILFLMLIVFSVIFGPQVHASTDARMQFPDKTPLARLNFGAFVLAPFAHVRFCLDHPQDCTGAGASETERHLDETTWGQLVDINLHVNRAIKPMRDRGGPFGDVWSIAPPRGDCDDYAVTKRHALLEKGWPASALLLAQVRLSSGENHLIVVARTDRGDYVLDNLTGRIKPWIKTGYKWISVQAPEDPALWKAVF